MADTLTGTTTNSGTYVLDGPGFSGAPPSHLDLADFQAGRGGDVLNLYNFGLSVATDEHYTGFDFGEIYNDMTDQSGGTLLTIDQSTVLFDNLHRDDFNATNFDYTDGYVGHPPPPADSVQAYLTVRVSEDAWNGDAQFRVLVDGHQMSGSETATASHSAGDVQEFDYPVPLNVGSIIFPNGPHTVQVEFVNDAYGGTPDTDRNLYVQSVSWNAYNETPSPVTTTYSGQTAANTGAGPDTDPNAAEVYSDGTVTFTNVGGSSSPPPPGPDTLVLHLSEDAWNGDAQFAVLVDGTQSGGPTSVTTLHSSGTFQDFTFTGDFGAGPHTVQVNFLNDAWGGTPDTDRNLYVGGITFDGTAYAGQTAQNTAFNGGPDTDPHAAEMYANGAVTFTNVGGSSPPPSATSTMTLHVSEDAWNGDAQFNVRVDGAAQIATFTAQASHAQGAVQDITITGDFGAQGPGSIDIQFLNDAWGGTPDTDRNLYVQSIDVNGVHFAGNTATDTAANGHEADDPSAAVMDINGTATFNVNHTAPPEVMG